MPELCEKTYCTGCSACMNSCPTGAVAMCRDSEGFLYPKINEELCISCGKCERSCPILNHDTALTQTKAYAAINAKRSIRDISTSGGVFTLLAEYIISNGGVVFGASYNEDFSVSHCFAETDDELRKFRGAKYVQSDIGLSYKKAESFLENGRFVLFSGTPCQIAGLQSYLGKDYEKLICVDLICHGIPSPMVWKKYIDHRAKIDNNGIRPEHIDMRSKITGWQRYSVEFRYYDKTYSKMFADDAYMHGYIKDLYTRPSCFDCKFKGIQRTGDFTLGDYWGIESQHPEMNDGMGTSLVFVHSEKAALIWHELAKLMCFKEVDTKTAIQWNPMAVQSTTYQEKREEFFARYKNEDFEQLVWELSPKVIPKKNGIFVRIKNKIQRILNHD